MKKLAYITTLWAIALILPVSAQTEPVSPRFEVRYTTEGAGFDSLGSIEGFVPVFQNPGDKVTFLEGRVFLDNGSTMGGNLVLGHRIYDKTSDRVTGGYISYDARDTGESYFKQLGLGFESLGNIDFRANAYLPLGDTRSLVTETLIGNPSFQGNNLVVQQANKFEVALHGIDAEIGTRLTKIGSGDLRGYAGLYYLGSGEKEAFGWKTRLEARPTNFLGLGLSLQNDALFDTRATFTIGLSFPASNTTKGNSNQSNTLARMGDFVQRQTAIPVVEDIQIGLSDPLTNPATDQPWRITRVASANPSQVDQAIANQHRQQPNRNRSR